MKKSKIAIIGYGTSALFLGSLLSKEDNIELTIFDKNDTSGKKLALTSSGRGNILNTNSYKDLVDSYNLEARDLVKSLYKSIKVENIINYFENELGLLLDTEDHCRVFPKTKKAKDVIKALESSIKAKIYYNTPVVKIKENSDNTYTLNEIYTFNKVIIAVGGASFKHTGSNADIIKISKSLDLKYQPFKAALAPIKVKEQIQTLQGIVLNDIIGFSKTESFANDLMFTINSLTGPLALSLRASCYKGEKLRLQLLSDKKLIELEQQIIKGNKTLYSILNTYFPKRFTHYLLTKRVHLSKDLKSLSRQDRVKLLSYLSNLDFTINDEGNIDTAYCSYGGLKIEEINKLTFELKKYKNLYCIGEALNCSGYSGGYNCTFAFASAYKVANTIIKELQ